jgi:hypothetical protein
MTTRTLVPRNISFSDLPTEIRNQIWEETFEPRFLSLGLHGVEIPMFSKQRCRHMRCRNPTLNQSEHCNAAIVFTARLGIHPQVLQVGELPSETSPIIKFRGCDIFESDYSALIKQPPGPVSLYVCQHSRAMALRHYRLAFPGKNLVASEDAEFTAFFDSTPFLSQPRIWVNFSLDTIFYAYSYPWSVTAHPNAGAYTFTSRFLAYARGDAMKIERLALRGYWVKGKVQDLLLPPGGLLNGLGYYEACKEVMFFLLEHGVLVNHRDERELSREIREFMEIEGPKTENWKWNATNLPDVRVSREIKFCNSSIGEGREARLKWCDPTKETV